MWTTTATDTTGGGGRSLFRSTSAAETAKRMNSDEGRSKPAFGRPGRSIGPPPIDSGRRDRNSRGAPPPQPTLFRAVRVICAAHALSPCVGVTYATTLEPQTGSPNHHPNITFPRRPPAQRPTGVRHGGIGTRGRHPPRLLPPPATPCQPHHGAAAAATAAGAARRGGGRGSLRRWAWHQGSASPTLRRAPCARAARSQGPDVSDRTWGTGWAARWMMG